MEINFTKLITKLLIFIGAFVGSFSQVGAQSTSIIGAGSQTGTSVNGATGDSGPMYKSSGASSFNYSRYHYLYLDSELSGSGMPPGVLISKIAWRKANDGATFNVPANQVFEIWIKNSTATTPPAIPVDFSVLTTGSTNVFNTTALVVLPDTGWVEFTFTTPFVYTGGSLEISTNFDVSAANGTTNGFSWHRDPISSRTIAFTNSSPSTILNVARDVRPQVRFTHQPNSPCVDPPTPGIATTSAITVCAGQNFNLSLQGTSFGAGQTYQWESSLDSISWLPMSNANQAFLSTTQASAVAYYRCQVTCGNTTLPTPGVKVNAIINALGGFYTVDASQPASAFNFQNLSDALLLINCAGLTSPTTLALASGTYTGSYSISNYNGNVANSLTITSLANNIDSVVFNNGTTGIIFDLNGAENIVFSGITLNSSTGAPTGIRTNLNVAASNNITVVGCKLFTDQASTSSNNRNIYMTTTNNFVCLNNQIDGGYYGIYHVGAVSPNFTQNMFVADNIFTNTYFYSIFTTNQENIIIDNNTFTNFRTNVSAYAIYFSRSNNFTVSNNIIKKLTGIYGIYVSNGNGTVTNPNRIFNNSISGTFASATPRAIYIIGSTVDGLDNYEIVNNSVWLKTATTSATANGAFFFTGGSATAPAFSGITLLNNSIMVEKLPASTTSALATMYFSYADLPLLVTSNHNNLHYENQGSAPIVRVAAVNYATLAAWNTASTKDAFSISLNPQYLSDTLLMLLPNSPNNAIAVPIPYAANDITGAPRDPSTPDAGAYEVNVFGCTGPVGIAADSLSYNAARIAWFSSQSLWNLEYGLQGFTQGSGTIIRGVNTNPYLIPGLIPNTDYHVYIQDSCSAGNSSWIGPVSFRTLKDVDANLLGFINPRANGCADPSVPIQVSVRNDGLLPLTSFSVNITYSGFINGTLNQTFTTNLASGALDTFTVGTLNLSLGGTLNLNALATVLNDRDTLNNRKLQTSNIISVSAPLVSALSDTVCIGQSATLNVTNPNPSISVGWFDNNGVQIGAGNSFVTPPITANTTFTARGLGNVEYPVGPADTSFGAAAAFAAASVGVQSMLIDALEPMKLVRTRVYPETTGWLVIELRTTAGVTVATDSVFVTQTSPYAGITINCDLDIPVGSWRLGCLTNQSAGGMLRNSTNAAYPYSIPGKFAITGSTFGAAYYYYFYGMVLSQGGCPTDSTLKTIVAKPAPIAAFTSSLTTGTTYGFDASTSQNGSSYDWDFGDGSTGTGITTNHTYSNSGTYQVVLVVGSSNNCGTDTITQSITIQALPQPDLVMLGIISPTQGATVNQSTPVTVRYANIGNAPAPVFDIAYSVNGVSQNTNTVTSIIQPNDTLTFTFTQPWLPTQGGNYEICAYFNTADNNPSNDTSCVSVSSSVRVDNLLFSNFQIFPNPSNGLFIMEFEPKSTSRFSYKVLDVLGKVVLSEDLGMVNGKFNKTVNLTNIASGTYLLQISSDAGTINEKVIITR